MSLVHMENGGYTHHIKVCIWAVIIFRGPPSQGSKITIFPYLDVPLEVSKVITIPI